MMKTVARGEMSRGKVYRDRPVLIARYSRQARQWQRPRSAPRYYPILSASASADQRIFF